MIVIMMQMSHGGVAEKHQMSNVFIMVLNSVTRPDPTQMMQYLAGYLMETSIGDERAIARRTVFLRIFSTVQPLPDLVNRFDS